MNSPRAGACCWLIPTHVAAGPMVELLAGVIVEDRVVPLPLVANLQE